MFWPYLWTIPRALTMAAASLQAAISGQDQRNTTLACADLVSALGVDSVIWPSNFVSYQLEINRYYSQACGDLLPRCIVYPRDTDDVSRTVTLINGYSDVRLAVKSGGHNHNLGFNNVNGGVLVSLSRLNNVLLSEDQETADVGPGARWGGVQSVLDGYNRTVVGGRISDVGVGGSILGGGLSFLSPQYGLACDNVLNLEIVLPNGTVANANQSNHPELFFALKGGGGQFGIVTKFTMRSYPLGKVWGGYRLYRYTHAHTLVNALHLFLQGQTDPRASVILTHQHVFRGTMKLAVVFYFYAAPTPPPGAFGLFETIVPFLDNTKTRSYSELLRVNDRLANTRGARILIRISPIPHIPGKKGKEILNHHVSASKTFIEKISPRNTDLFVATAFQPVPRSVTEQSLARGDNALGMDPDNGDFIWFGTFFMWTLPSDDETVIKYSQLLTEELESYTAKRLANRTIGNDKGSLSPTRNQLPQFMNEAMADQPVVQSYGERSIQRLRAVRDEVDPKGEWARRTDGWRVDVE